MGYLHIGHIQKVRTRHLICQSKIQEACKTLSLEERRLFGIILTLYCVMCSNIIVDYIFNLALVGGHKQPKRVNIPIVFDSVLINFPILWQTLTR